MKVIITLINEKKTNIKMQNGSSNDKTLGKGVVKYR